MGVIPCAMGWRDLKTLNCTPNPQSTVLGSQGSKRRGMGGQGEVLSSRKWDGGTTYTPRPNVYSQIQPVSQAPACGVGGSGTWWRGPERFGRNSNPWETGWKDLPVPQNPKVHPRAPLVLPKPAYGGWVLDWCNHETLREAVFPRKWVGALANPVYTVGASGISGGSTGRTKSLEREERDGYG